MAKAMNISTITNRLQLRRRDRERCQRYRGELERLRPVGAGAGNELRWVFSAEVRRRTRCIEDRALERRLRKEAIMRQGAEHTAETLADYGGSEFRAGGTKGDYVAAINAVCDLRRGWRRAMTPAWDVVVAPGTRQIAGACARSGITGSDHARLLSALDGLRTLLGFRLVRSVAAWRALEAAAERRHASVRFSISNLAALPPASGVEDQPEARRRDAPARAD